MDLGTDSTARLSERYFSDRMAGAWVASVPLICFYVFTRNDDKGTYWLFALLGSLLVSAVIGAIYSVCVTIAIVHYTEWWKEPTYREDHPLWATDRAQALRCVKNAKKMRYVFGFILLSGWMLLYLVWGILPPLFESLGDYWMILLLPLANLALVILITMPVFWAVSKINESKDAWPEFEKDGIYYQRVLEQCVEKNYGSMSLEHQYIVKLIKEHNGLNEESTSTSNEPPEKTPQGLHEQDPNQDQ